MLEHLQAEPVRPDRVVVLGAGGFVGGAIAARLTADGIPVLALSRDDMDLTADDAHSTLAGVLHAGDVVVFVSAQAPCKTVDGLVANIAMARAVCGALGDVEAAHVVYISSDAVYAADANPVTERSCCHPLDLHGTMHLARENMLRAAIKAPLAILRPSLLFGAADPHNGYGPNRFRRTAATEGKITLFGEGEEQRDHVHIRDVAEIVHQAIGHRSRGILNIATGESVSFRQVAELVAAQFEGAVDIVGTPRANPITHRHFDITDCLKAFPRFVFTPLAEGIARTHGGES